MRARFIPALRLAVACLALGTFAFGAIAAARGQELAPPSVPPSEAEDGVEVLTRGPVHEAFAETVTFDAKPGEIAPKAPPADIEELPPDQKPEGENVVWIPGYWAWDEERNDFLWVSGIWRAMPPGRQWVSGYWATTATGAQWTSGYWADAKSEEIEYLPQPPATVEVGPNVAAPAANYNWLPGCWVWHESRYAWRPGFWAPVNEQWDWIPAHYVWTPRGCVFVEGYWDRKIVDRGVLFAPVYFQERVVTRRTYVYSPVTVISLNVFTEHVFVRQSCRHYYFGDYYDDHYTSAGYCHGYAPRARQYCYDPIYIRFSWNHRDDHDWKHKREAEIQHRHDHKEARPPKTLADQKKLLAEKKDSPGKDIVLAKPLGDVAKSEENTRRFKTVDQEEKLKLAEREKDLKKYRDERQKLEIQPVATTGEKVTKKTSPEKVKLPKPVLVAKPIAEQDKNQTTSKNSVLTPGDSHADSPVGARLESKMKKEKDGEQERDRDKDKDREKGKDKDKDRDKERVSSDNESTVKKLKLKPESEQGGTDEKSKIEKRKKESDNEPKHRSTDEVKGKEKEKSREKIENVKEKPARREKESPPREIYKKPSRESQDPPRREKSPKKEKRKDEEKENRN